MSDPRAVSRYTWSVFAKPWPMLHGPALASLVARLGFDGIEAPVRDGHEVTPTNVEQRLADLARTFADADLRIFSVAGNADERLFAACERASIPFIRVMAPVVADYLESESRIRAELAALVPLCERYSVAVLVQQHHGRFVSTAGGLRSLLADLPREHILAAWDAGHNALSGEDPDLALAQLEGRIGMINLKNGLYRRLPQEEGGTRWQPVWVSGAEGLGDWADVGSAVAATTFTGTVCLSAQYTGVQDVDQLARIDLEHARTAFAS
ncbi:MAG TPA: sugar phosphate isomerase/epimerase [Microbacteriaceae bacterium]